MNLTRQKIWQGVLGELEVGMSKANFKTWVKNTQLVSIEGTTATVSVPHIFARDRLATVYNDQIIEALRKLVPDIVAVEYVVGSSASDDAEDIAAPQQAPSTPNEKPKPKPQAVTQTSESPQLSLQSSSIGQRYSFENFVVGSGNRLAFSAAKLVSEKPGVAYNPLFLYGPPGVGKTHLMWAISSAVAAANPDAKITYITTEDFLNQFTNAIRKGENFSARYRNVDVLLVDDLQFIAGKEKTQEEFFHTFNALHQSNKQIVLCSDRPPKAIATLEDRLRSRFEWGMVADIQPPDYETRVAIIQSKAMDKNFEVSTEVAAYIAETIQSNIRELEGGLTRVIAYCQAHGVPLTPEVAQTVLGGSLNPSPKNMTPKQIIERTAAFYDIKVTDLTGAKRDKDIVVPRQIAMYIMRRELGMSFPQIASSLGGRDHTTVMHGVRKINKLAGSNEPISHEIQTLKQKIFSS
jgi:chromosomal replication initiator protein